MEAIMSKQSNIAGRPVQVVSQFESGFRFQEHAFLDILRDSGVSDKKIAVVSIAGAFRKGKSFISNIFVDYLEKSEKGAENGSWCKKDSKLDKFHWICGDEPDTTGIYIWSRPFMRKDKNGDEVAVFLMDTQGTFDSRSTVKQCATIFALSTMLSSLTIFNVSMNIQEDDLQNLALFTEYAKLAKTNCSETPFQQLLFLVRDWQNSDKYDYGFKGGENFLKTKLKATAEHAREQKELRNNLESSFQQISCFLMPHPGLKIANNNKNNSLADADEDFLEKVPELVEAIFDEKNVQAKTIAGQKLTCKQLAQYFEGYTALFNSDQIPEPKSILQATAEIVEQQAFYECTVFYERIVTTIVDSWEPDVAKLARLHDTTKAVTLIKFDEARQFGGNQGGNDNRIKLEEHMERIYVNLKQRVVEIQSADMQRRGTVLQLEEINIRNEHQKRYNKLMLEEYSIKIDLLRKELNGKNVESSRSLDALQDILKFILAVAIPHLFQ